MPDRSHLLATPLTELPVWRLAIHCAHCREMAVRRVAELRDQGQTLGDILPRLRCARCGAAPTSVQVRSGERWNGTAREAVRVAVLGDPAVWSE